MNNQLLQFTNELFGNIRIIIDEQGNPWFIGNEIASILGYARPRDAVHDHVYEEDKGSVKMALPLGGTQNTTIINESGLYSLIFSSQLPKAREFKRWVTSEILPAMRKIGFQESENLLRNEISRLQNDNMLLRRENSKANDISIHNAYIKLDRDILSYNIIHNPYLTVQQKIDIFKYDPTTYNPELDITIDTINFKKEYNINI